MKSQYCRRIFAVSSVLAVFAFVYPSVSAWGVIQVGEHFPAEIETPLDYSGTAGPEPEAVWSYELSHPGATYIAIHFVDFDLAPGDFLIISDPQANQIYTLQGKGKMGAGTFWARHIKGDTAIMQLMAVSENGGSGFLIDEYAAGFAETLEYGIEAICGTDDKENAVCYQVSHPDEYQRGRAVARLLIHKFDGDWFCTGWLASPDNHFITNQHCIETAADALNTDYEFMAEAPTCGSFNCQLCHPGTIFSGATFIQNNANLDYALVRINTGNPASTYGYLQIDNRQAVVGEQIYIPQHPSGRAKEFAIYSTHPSDAGGICRVFSTTEIPCVDGSPYNDIGYYADTEGGSSGSPVLATSGHKVIALHHCAVCPNRGVPINLIYPEIMNFLGLHPPTAYDDTVNTPNDTPVDITLWAIDDGDPNPPGVLTYTIRTLPGDGNLSDPCAGVINLVPYELVDFSNVVKYTTDSNFKGTDGFTFDANDGGTDPNGGVSNEATILVVVGLSCCHTVISPCLYSESFEGGFGDWENATGDDIDWTRNSGSTPSIGTGPSSAHEGTYYLYTEASDTGYPDKTAILDGPCLDLKVVSNPQLSFWYHMYGEDVGTLILEASDDCGNWTPLWSLSGNQGDSWYEVIVDLSSYSGSTIHIRFKGLTGSGTYGWSSDIAIDDISISGEPNVSCNRETGNPAWPVDTIFEFTNEFGFGTGSIDHFHYVWDQNQTYPLNGSESNWASGTLNLTGTLTGRWYIHLLSHNSEHEAGSTLHLGPYYILDAPVLTAEPNITSGTSNTISWSPVPDVNGYYAECANDANFANIIADSGWITQTSWEFAALELGQKYWYNVKTAIEPNIETWSQTLQAEFLTDTLTDTTATGGDDVVLAEVGGPGSYASLGTIISTQIDLLPQSEAWSVVSFSEMTPPDTNLTVDVLYGPDESVIILDVNSGTDINDIGIISIKLKANLSTNDPNFTPALHDWTVTYTNWAQACQSNFSNVESSVQCGSLGDFEPDCDVDMVDIGFFVSRWLDTDCNDSAGDESDWCFGTDFDKKGSVNLSDFAELSLHWLEYIGPD